MTPWEQKLWYLFLRTYKPRFLRQKPIGPYIADFYCSKCKLVIELDGSGHLQTREEDKKRDVYFQTLGIRVLRFYNTDIQENFGGVCSVIHKSVNESIS